MKLFRFLMPLGLSMALAACGGGGGDAPASFGPTARAGADQTVAMGDTVTLNGTTSTAGSTGGALTYAWTLASKPTGSAAALSSAAASAPSFTADRPGTYTAQLIVNDGVTASAASSVTVTATTAVPVAIAEPAQTVLVGATVQLDGHASAAPTGSDASLLTYEWTLVTAPTGGPATLTNANTAQASFYANVVGTYTATLVVRHGTLVSDTQTVTITAQASNSIPVAAAKVSLIDGVAAVPTNATGIKRYAVPRGATVTLDAGDSTDGDGDTLSYRWYFFAPVSTSGAAGTGMPTASQLSRSTVLTGRNPTFTPDTAGTWTIYLYAFDGTSVSSLGAATQVTLNVTKPADAANTPPVAVFMAPGDSYEVEIGTVAFRSGNSYDIDGDTLTRRFRWISTPAGYTQADLTGLTSFSFTPNVAGDYVVELIVNDGTVDSAPAIGTFRALTGANVKPVANVTIDSSTLLVGSTMWFDGRTSSDVNGDALSYQWTLIDKPDGSTATLQTPNAARSSLVADRPGTYIARLMVTDGLGATNALTTVNYGKVQVKTRNNAPAFERLISQYTATFISNWANPSPGGGVTGTDEQPVIAGNPVLFNARSVIDPDNDTLYYLWTLAQPQGSTLTDAVTTQTMTFTPLVAGTYTGTFVASDGVASSASGNISIKVVAEADYPTILLKAYGLSSNLTNMAPTAFPYHLADSVYTTRAYYSLTAYGGDYTIANLATTSATDGVGVPVITGLTNGQVIRRGETVQFSVAPPDGLSTTAPRDLLATFSIAERPGYVFNYRFLRQ